MGWNEPRRDEDETTASGVSPIREDAIVIPIHGKSFAPVEEAPERAEPITRRPSTPAVPLADRPWRLLVVPPTPGAPTRAFHIRRWQAKAAAWGIGALALIAVLNLVAIGWTVFGQDPEPTAEEQALMREGLLAFEDSVALARSLQEAQAEYERDSITAVAIAGPNGSARLLENTRRMREDRKSMAIRRFSAPRTPAVGTETSSLENFPVIGALTSKFSNARRHPILRIIRKHSGVDVAARYGTRITAPAAGRVTYVGKNFAYGNVVEMEHGGGITTRYAHASSILVREGQEVAKGALIATVGSSGLATGPHLHYEVIVNGKNVDPLKFRMPQPAAADTAASGVAEPDAGTAPAIPQTTTAPPAPR